MEKLQGEGGWFFFPRERSGRVEIIATTNFHRRGSLT